MGTPVSSATSAEMPPSKSFVERLVGIFLSPGPTFADIARKPGFIVPMIVVLLSAVVVNETMLAKIGISRITRTALEQSSFTAKMSPEQKDQIVERSSQGFRLALSHISPLVYYVFLLVIVAAIGLAIVNAVFGGQTNFKTALSVTCYANFVRLIGAVMAIPMILFGDPENFRLESFIPTNPGFFLNPQEVSKPLYALASSFDIVSLWIVALLGIGFAALRGRRARVMPTFLSFLGLWLVVTLIKMGWAAAFG